MRVNVAVIGAGPAGLAAAIAAKESGAEDVVVIDREMTLGGILPQCIHSGFGLKIFEEELTGPEYAARFAEKARACGVLLMTETMVLDISKDRVITAAKREYGMVMIEAGAIVLATGCRERTAGALMIPGDRPSGVLTAGTAQRFVNIDGYLPGKEVVILGSGDIGLIMARRMALEGAHVKMVTELMPYPGGLARNIMQCLCDFGIPLKLSHTVTRIHGRKRLEGVTITAVGKDLKPVSGTDTYVSCDTLLLSAGLIPENELARGIGAKIDPLTGGPAVDSGMQTTCPGIFACGNTVHVHDIADFVTEEAMRAGWTAVAYLKDGNVKEHVLAAAGDGVKYVVPQRLLKDGHDKTLFFRTAGVYKNCRTVAVCGGQIIADKRRAKCSPSEMETLTLCKGDIVGNVTVYIKEDT
ncbi:MAG: NAD(P)/FAD-dependent oxidoreductase [Christensenellales bacterium]|jgi:NADPH-dependent 2,4-dienoyl-CoA reductase/sulfur reductase-like enzyme